MKYLIALFTLCLLISACDVELKAKKRAKKAFIYYSENDKLKAAQMFHKLVLKYPQSNFYGKNLFNAAYIYQEIDSFSIAIPLYNQILESSLNDSEKDSSRQIGITRSNYKYFACRNLASIYLKLNQPNEALHYLFKGRDDFPFITDSSVTAKREEILLKQDLATAYLQKNLPDSALVTVLSDALIESPWIKHKAKDLAMSIIKEYYNPDQVLEDLIQGFENLNVHPAFIIIPFRDLEIIIVPYLSNIENMSGSYFKSTALYVDLYRLVHYSNNK